ncbi:MAG: ribosome-associated translation inhibitor RaiA [Planctomycetota bacterium]|nr:ribosome-associated translation inhibitor RaiA [Planctomycetota bacterium]
MKVSVVARHVELTDAMKDYAREKVDGLPHFYNGLQSVDITFDVDAGEHVVEIVATGKRKSVFVAHHRGRDMYACVDQCAHKLEEQLRRHKDKVRDRHGPTHEQINSRHSINDKTATGNKEQE